MYFCLSNTYCGHNPISSKRISEIPQHICRHIHPKNYCTQILYNKVLPNNKAGYNTDHESEIFNFKNLETVLEEAVIMMLEHEDITQVTVENLWYKVLLTVENKEDVLRDAEDWCEALDALKSAVKVEITLNY